MIIARLVVALVLILLSCVTAPPLVEPPPVQTEGPSPTDAEVDGWLWRTLDVVVARMARANPRVTWSHMQQLTAIPDEQDFAHSDAVLWAMVVACKSGERCQLSPSQFDWVVSLMTGNGWCEGPCPQVHGTGSEQGGSRFHPGAVVWSAFRRNLGLGANDVAHGDAPRTAAEFAILLNLPLWLEVLAPMTGDLHHWCVAATMPNTTDAIIATAARLNACPPDGADLLAMALQRHPYDPELLMMALERLPDGGDVHAARQQLLTLVSDDVHVVEKLATDATKRREWIDAVELWHRYDQLHPAGATMPVAQMELWKVLRLDDKAFSGKLERLQRRIEGGAREVPAGTKPGAFANRSDLRITFGTDGKASDISVVDAQGKRIHSGDHRLAHVVARWWRARLAPPLPEGQTLIVHVELP
jgi:hypothetical protein